MTDVLSIDAFDNINPTAFTQGHQQSSSIKMIRNEYITHVSCLISPDTESFTT